MTILGEIPKNLKRERNANYGIPTRRKLKNNISTYRQARFVTTIFNALPNSTNSVLNNNANRVYLIIQNNGVATVLVNFNNKTNTTSIQIPPGGNYEPFVTPIDSIFISSATAQNNLCTLIEGVKIQ